MGKHGNIPSRLRSPAFSNLEASTRSFQGRIFVIVACYRGIPLSPLWFAGLLSRKTSEKRGSVARFVRSVAPGTHVLQLQISAWGVGSTAHMTRGSVDRALGPRGSFSLSAGAIANSQLVPDCSSYNQLRRSSTPFIIILLIDCHLLLI